MQETKHHVAFAGATGLGPVQNLVEKLASRCVLFSAQLMSFNENFVRDAMSDIARHMLAMGKFVDAQNFESAHTEAVIIISAYRALTDQLLIHIRKEKD